MNDNDIGQFNNQSHRTLEFLRDGLCPDYTSHELAALFSIPQVSQSPVMAPLRRKGLVVNGEKRVCRESGAKCLTWRITVNGRRFINRVAV